MSQFELVAILLVLTATFSWVNFRLAVLPHTIGLLVMGLCASLVVIGAEAVLPGLFNYEGLATLLRQVDFQQTVLEGMLAFLLFAGALHVDVVSLRSRAVTIGTMATLGVVVSTSIIGCVVWAAADLLGVAIPLPWALVFGALISPTDPVAVLATLKEVKVPEDLKIVMTGETLFNDGVGVVLFAVLVHSALGDGFDAFQVGKMFVVEALGGAALGAVSGYVAYRAMRAIDDYSIEVLISLALVVGTYAIASRLVVSGPLAVVVAGLLVGSRGPHDALSDQTQRYLFGFWTLIDEMLNSVLFLLIGLEVLVLRFEPAFGWLMALAVPLVLVARLAAVSGPVLLLGLFRKFARGTIPVLTWGGLAGRHFCGAGTFSARSRREICAIGRNVCRRSVQSDRSGAEPACSDQAGRAVIGVPPGYVRFKVATGPAFLGSIVRVFEAEMAPGLPGIAVVAMIVVAAGGL